MEEESQHDIQKIECSAHVRMLKGPVLNPSPILNLHFQPALQNHAIPLFNTDRLYITRTTHSQIYALNTNSSIIAEHLFTIPVNPSRRVFEIDNFIISIFDFQLRGVNLADPSWDWQVHPFTTQYVDFDLQKHANQNQFYTFHENEAMRWWIQDEKIRFSYLAQNDQPYHITAKGDVQGFGKKLKCQIKNVQYTCCQRYYFNKESKKSLKGFDNNKNDVLFIGDSSGGLHIYQCQYLTHVKTFKKHIGPILSIKINNDKNVVYWTGSDSKVCSIRRIKNAQWELSGQHRGQSHDIMSLQVLKDKYLISGGLTTDLCFYQLDKQSSITTTSSNKVSYSSDKLIHSIQTKGNKIIILNKMNKFEIWQYNNESLNLHTVYNCEKKLIKSVKISQKFINKESEQYHFLVLLTTQETVVYKFSLQNGLIKYFTIQHSYLFFQFISNSSIIALRDSFQQEIQKINCENGKIIGIVDESNVLLPTQMIYYQSQPLYNIQKQFESQEINQIVQKNKQKILLVGSKITNTMNIYNIRTKKLIKSSKLYEVQGATSSKGTLPYTFAEIYCGNKRLLEQVSLIIKFLDDSNLKVIQIPSISSKLNKSKKKQQQPVSIHSIAINISKIRYGGWVNVMVKNRIKRFFYCISEGKFILLSNILQKNKVHKIRTKQMERIGGVVGKFQDLLEEYHGDSLLLIPMDIRTMIKQGQGALIAKRITV